MSNEPEYGQRVENSHEDTKRWWDAAMAARTAYDRTQSVIRALNGASLFVQGGMWVLIVINLLHHNMIPGLGIALWVFIALVWALIVPVWILGRRANRQYREWLKVLAKM